MQIRPRPALRFAPAALAALAAVAIAVAAPTVAAAPSPEALARIEPRLDRQVLEEAVAAANPDRETRSIIEVLYSDYASAIGGLAEDLEAARDEAGADEVESALTGRRLVDPARLRALRASVREADRPFFGRANTLVTELLESASIMLVGDAADVFMTRLPAIRRTLYLHPRRRAGFEPTYLGDGVDLVELADAIASLPGTTGYEPALVDDLLDAYAARLDDLLVAQAEADWQGRIDQAVARILRDDAARRVAERAAIERWSVFFTLTDETARAIERRLEEEVGGTCALVWREQYERACFPWLWEAVRPEVEFDWIRGRIEDEAIRARALEIFQQYRMERSGLAADTMRIVVTARREHGVILDPRLDPLALDGPAAELFRRLLRTSGEIEQLDQAASDAFGGLLEANERARMRADVNARMFRRR